MQVRTGRYRRLLAVCLLLAVLATVACSGSGKPGSRATSGSSTTGSPATSGGGPSGSQAVSATTPGARLEMDLTGNGSNLNMGEPEIAINPLKPNEMYLDGATFPFPLVINGPSPVPNTCGGMISEDGGSTWQPEPFPPTRCEDGIAVFGPDGMLYVGGDVATSTSVVRPGTPGAISVGSSAILVQGYDPIFHSTDSGHTWSAPVKTMGSTNLGPFPFASGSGNPSNTFDRPWIVVDQSTNTLYAEGHNIADHEGFVTASTNSAQSFGPIYAIDSPAYPQSGFGGNIAAAHGTLAAAYAASQAPGATCPCVIFETTTDHGATFTRHVVPLVNAPKQPDPYITADPAASGHFALTVLDATGSNNLVYVTDDSGNTWHGPATVGEAPENERFKPWLSYGPAGLLALVWRTRYSDGSYDVWSAISRTSRPQGPLFSAPLKISSAAAPYPKGYFAGDDFSFIVADSTYVHVGWGDSRDVAVGGGVQIWYARVPLDSFGKPAQ